MFSKRVVISTLAFGVSVACAEAEDAGSGAPSSDAAGQSHGGGQSGQGGQGGKLPTAGTSAIAAGGAAGVAGTSSVGKAGASSGGASHAGTSNGGSASGGSAGAQTGGVAGNVGVGGSSSAGTAGTSTTGLSCTLETLGGAPGSGGADASAAGADNGVGGASTSSPAFFDDFESGVSKWTTTLGTWALVDDGSQAYDQSLQENKLQLAVANGVCLADQIIDAKVKVVAFKGQSNSYVAALFGRVLSPSTHYLLALGSDGKLALRKRVNSTSTGATAIGTAAALSITAGSWYDVHFDIIGTTLKGCVGAVCVTGTDSSIASGSVGVGTVNTAARFDDARVSVP